jgi:segregation and condensation protein A
MMPPFPTDARLQSTPTGLSVRLADFEGPFDLLLFFIQRDEIDIHDIPIGPITAEFLSYLSAMEADRLDAAAEFIGVAAQLMKIKALLLLPREVAAMDAIDDPRTELVDRLLAYKAAQHLADHLAAQEEARQGLARRGAPEADLSRYAGAATLEEEISGLTTMHLYRAYQRVLAQLVPPPPPRHVIEPLPYTKEGVEVTVRAALTEAGGRCDFEALALVGGTRLYVVFVLLCVLDLAQQGEIRLQIAESTGAVWVVKRAAF